MELKAKYEQRIEQAEAELRQVKNKILRISTLRVLLFAAGIIGTIYFYQAGTPTICLTIAVTFVPFLALVKYHNRLFFRKDWLETCIRVNSDELSALADNYEPFEDGKEFTNPAHRYSFDLDLFGRHSLFQALNRTCTSFGKEKLAEWLQNHLEIKEEIIQRQEATKELAAYSDFRETFRITGLLYKGATSDREEIKEWTEAPAYFSKKWWSRPLLGIVPGVNIVLAMLGVAGVIPMTWFGLAFGLFVIGSFGLIKPVSNLQRVYDKKLRILSIYAELISLIENREMNAPLLRHLKAEFGMNGKSTTHILKELSRELDKLDLRNNQLLYVLLEGSMFWQLRQVMRIEQWRHKYGKYLLHAFHRARFFTSAITFKNRSFICASNSFTSMSLPVHGTNPPAIDAWPPPLPIPFSASATIFPASSILFSLRTESLIPSDFLEYTTENDTSFKASMKSDIFAMTGQSLPVLQKLMSSYTSILEIALEYAIRSSKHRLLFSNIWMTS